jgi:prepilin peptidase CpaA
MTQATTIVFIAIMAAAMISDVRTNRIPNALVGTGFAAALALQALSGWSALASGLIGAGLALLVTVPLFALGAIGGGDAKLFAVVGAFMGPYGFFLALLASAVVGGVLGVGSALRRGVILPVLLGCKDLFVNAVTLGRHGSRQKLEAPGAITIPYGAAIAVGSVATWFLLATGI